nr:aquaporin-like protein [Tanacetum cinerariifolium]
MATGDKYDPLVIPCKPTTSQVLILQSFALLSQLDRGKHKLPVLLDKKVTENSRREGECSRHDVFKETINRVLRMLVAQGKGKGVDFLESGKEKGHDFPSSLMEVGSNLERFIITF